MPPFCCGGRRCANDAAQKEGLQGQMEGDEAKDTIYTTAADYERPLTLKFYARHDWPYFNCTPEEIRQIREKLDPESLKVAGRLTDARRQSSSEDVVLTQKVDHPTAQPMTENQIYGWYQDRAYRYLKRDRGIFVFPHENDPYIQQILSNKFNNTR
ncbi:uncharacterized protein LOC113565527 [Drosophila persimilis]|uniref:uncharacterized protein LOC113565527 n=1 Tax=Drosophila persimilis TaxID=7234 RepID=UPI000F0803FC|nr:uncharacterized protein LOC113565527 [Drosophila persimilis]